MRIRHINRLLDVVRKMNGFPMFALKPYAECAGIQEFSVQEMGTCRLVFSDHVEDVFIVVYTQALPHEGARSPDGSMRAQLLGIRRSTEILFYCADLTKMTVSVSSIDSVDSEVTFRNKPLKMKPGMFKLTRCPICVITWARTIDICATVTVSQSQLPPRAAVPLRTVARSLPPPPSAENESSEEDSESRDTYDLEVLTTAPKDSARFPWLVRVKVKSSGKRSGEIGYLCKLCLVHEQGHWSTQPCFSPKKQRKERHEESGHHLRHVAGHAGAADLSKVRSFQYDKT